MRKLVITAALFLSLGWSALAAAELPRDSRVPGGVAIIPLGKAEFAPTVSFDGKPVLVVEQDGGWHALIGIPLGTEPGPQRIEIDGQPHTFEVAPKAYAEQRLTVKRKYVAPSKEQLARYQSEAARSRAAMTTFSAEPPERLRFALPVEGPRSSPFGLQRFFNGEPRRPHSGLDLAAPVGTPIKAPARGRVVETGDFFFNGNSVFVDHGRGLISMYFHLQRVDVQPGDVVQAGDVLGTVGATGRVTGAHLHWGVALNGVSVDPDLFLTVSEQ